jgi:hypothetical protein
LIDAQNYLIMQQHKSQDDPQVKDLGCSLSYVQSKLGLIYGPHDIPGAFNELKSDIGGKVSISTIDQFGRNLRERASASHAVDQNYVAKLMRDVALFDLSYASYKASHGDGGGALCLYETAVEYLQTAGRTIPNAPDQVPLERLAALVAKQVPQAQPAPDSSSVNNPFSVN